MLEGWEECRDLRALKAHVGHEVDPMIVTGVHWVGPKMPAKMLQDVLGTIKYFPHKETGYVLLYNLSEKKWRVDCPDQKGGAGSVKFNNYYESWSDGGFVRGCDGYMPIGTIHTHPEMSARWSGTDLRDQCGSFGVHIVFGTKKGLVDTVLCTIFTPQGEYDVPLWDVCEEVELGKAYEGVHDWTITILKQNYEHEEEQARPSSDFEPERTEPVRNSFYPINYDILYSSEEDDEDTRVKIKKSKTKRAKKKRRAHNKRKKHDKRNLDDFNIIY